MTQGFINEARRFLQLRDQIKDLEAQAKDLRGELKTLGDALAAKMEDMGVENFALDDATFFLRATLRANVPADAREDFYAALRQREMGYLIKETIPANTLTAFVKEQLVDNGGVLPPWMEGMVSVYSAPEVAARAR